MTDISEARQALRDLARQELAIFTPTTEDALAAVTLVPLGEVAGQLFTALQNVLVVVEELREDANMPLDPELSGNTEAVLLGKEHQRELAELFESAVLKALS